MSVSLLKRYKNEIKAIVKNSDFACSSLFPIQVSLIKECKYYTWNKINTVLNYEDFTLVMPAKWLSFVPDYIKAVQELDVIFIGIDLSKININEFVKYRKSNSLEYAVKNTYAENLQNAALLYKNGDKESLQKIIDRNVCKDIFKFVEITPEQNMRKDNFSGFYNYYNNVIKTTEYYKFIYGLCSYVYIRDIELKLSNGHFPKLSDRSILPLLTYDPYRGTVSYQYKQKSFSMEHSSIEGRRSVTLDFFIDNDSLVYIPKIIFNDRIW